MIDFLVAWAEQIIVALIIIVIFEMIIPNSSNKKYLKVIFGIFIVYIIISPIISENSSNLINNMIKEVGSINEINSNSINHNQVDIINGTFDDVYEDNLEENIKDTLKQKGYDGEVEKIEIENNNISSLTLKINGEAKEKTEEQKNNDETVSRINEVKIEEIEISESKNDDKLEETENNDESIKSYISETYNIDKQNITIVRD